MVGARRYLASDGSTNFMGISAVEYDPDDSGSYSMLEEEAILWAKQAAILSLKASVESVKSAERLKRDIRGADGKVESKILKDFSANIQEVGQKLNYSRIGNAKNRTKQCMSLQGKT